MNQTSLTRSTPSPADLLRPASATPTAAELDAIDELRGAVLALIESVPNADGARYASSLLSAALTVTGFLDRATGRDVARPHALVAAMDEHSRALRLALGL